MTIESLGGFERGTESLAWGHGLQQIQPDFHSARVGVRGFYLAERAAFIIFIL
jgi:hypothetical protein